MKKIISIIAALAACVSLTACSGRTEAFSGVKLARIGIVDRMLIDNLEELEKNCDIAIVGTVIGEDVTDTPYYGWVDTSIIDSYNTIVVKEVLMGDVNVGDNLTIKQEYRVLDETLYTFSDLTPMVKGDEWVFFLDKDYYDDYYWITCDSVGRYPTKNSASKNSKLAFADSWKLGVYDKADFRQDIYNEIVEKYGV